jgi:two-component sensor histidine kinase
MSKIHEAEKVRWQSAALAGFGKHALRTQDLDALLQEAAELVSQATGVELVKVLELLPDGDTMLVRAGVNWKPGVVGHATFKAHRRSPGGYALGENAAVISPDVKAEDRFEIPRVLVDHGVRSMINVVIQGERRAWGVLEVDSQQRRDFNEDDVSFLQNYANLLAAAVERLETDAKLRATAERASILLGELQHRVRNMLLNVRTLALRTARTSASLEQFVLGFDARLLALARTQELLTQWSAVSVRLEDTLRQELKAHGADHGSRVLLSGPDVRLSAKVAQALGMAFHELATNASKYGALRYESAQLRINWCVVASEREEVLFIQWKETGVPLQERPSRRGFGSETIERSLPYMLGGEATMEFRPDGVECKIHFPFAPNEAVASCGAEPRNKLKV